MPNIADGQWHHFAVVRKQVFGEQHISLYVDGEYINTVWKDMTALNVDPNGLVLGQDQDRVGGGFDPNQALQGNLDELRIWQIERTADEISATYDQPLSGGENGLLAYYRFNETGGSAVTSVPAEERAGLKFDSVDDVIQVANSSSIDIQRTLTVEVTFTVDSFPYFANPIVWKGSSTDTTGAQRTYSLWAFRPGYLHFTSGDGSVQSTLNTDPGLIEKGRTYHFSGVVDRGHGHLPGRRRGGYRWGDPK